MKGKVILTGLFAAVLATTPALADYTSIQHNLFNTVPDTSFDPDTGVFAINATGGPLTLNDPTALGGASTSVSISLTTNFNMVTPAGIAQFVGGFLTLSFTFDPTGAPPPDTHIIEGPITGMLFDVTQAGPNGRIDGLGRWTAANVDLPGSNVWPDGGGFSSIDTLTIAFGQDLSNYDWEGDVPLEGNVQSLYSLFPDDRAVPEPASLALIALGGLGLLRRRR